jgi:hypothetical protein
VTAVNIDEFRRKLVRWVVQDQISYSKVRTEAFKELLICLQPAIDKYLINSHSTITSWCNSDYDEAFQRVKAILWESQSRIHLSCDIWTSPAAQSILGVCAHFLGSDLRLKKALLAMRELDGIHSGRNIGDEILEVIKTWDISERIGVCVADNASNIDAAVRHIFSTLRPDEIDDNPSARRSRCLGHIVNLAAQAFLFGKDCAAFADDIARAEEATLRDQRFLETEQEKWRRQGPVGKFHNIAKFIRASTQRRKEFSSVIKGWIVQAREQGLWLVGALELPY